MLSIGDVNYEFVQDSERFRCAQALLRVLESFYASRRMFELPERFLVAGESFKGLKSCGCLRKHPDCKAHLSRLP